jgi:quercetin dioxygenase-like cupin family protein
VSAYEVRRLDEFDVVPVKDADIDWRPVRRTLGIRAFGINAYTADEAGKHVVEEHSESQLRHEEVYVVVAGRARFTLGDDEVEAGPGTLVYLRDPDTRRAAVALEPGTAVLAVGGKPGEAYTPSAWEWAFAASRYRERGDYAQGLAIVRNGLEETGNRVLEYHVAYWEALNGNREAALAHLRTSVAHRPETRAWAREDEDFASLRDDPEFLAITREPDAGGERA